MSSQRSVELGFCDHKMRMNVLVNSKITKSFRACWKGQVSRIAISAALALAVVPAAAQSVTIPQGNNPGNATIGLSGGEVNIPGFGNGGGGGTVTNGVTVVQGGQSINGVGADGATSTYDGATNAGGSGGAVGGTSVPGGNTVTGANGGAGVTNTTFNQSGGGGGGGGAGLFLNGGTNTTHSGLVVTGGSGGTGGDSSLVSGVGGGGGGGVIVNGGMLTNASGASIAGGTGGMSGSVDPGGYQANNGAGGDGVVVMGGATFVNATGATVTGGAGLDNATDHTKGSQGGDAVRIVGDNGTMINAGTIQAGKSFYADPKNGAAIAPLNAVDISGNNTTFEIESTSKILDSQGNIGGKVVAQASSNNTTFALGGDTAGTFDASTIGTQYVGFDNLKKTGDGEWTLNGTPAASAAATPWTIEQGTLTISQDASLGSAGLVLDGGTLKTNGDIMMSRDIVVNSSEGGIETVGNTTVDGTISGSGSLIKTGAGTLTLTADNTYTGPTLVNQGGLMLAAGSSIIGGVNVASGTTFGGNGTVGGLSFASGAIYTVNVNAAGQSDRIEVVGEANIAGASVGVIAAPEAGGVLYKPSTTYNILTAFGGLNGSFSGVTTDLAFLTPSLSYDPTNVYLTMTRNDVKFGSVAQTGNQQAVGDAIDSMMLPNPLGLAIASLNASSARAAFDQLSGEIHPTLAGQMIEDSRFVRDAALDRLTDAFCGTGYGATIDKPDAHGVRTGTCVANPDRFTAWGHVFGAWGHQGSDGNAASLSRSIGGFIAGIDAPVYDDWRAGVLAGYSHSNFNVDNRDSSAASDDYTIGLYGGRTWGPLSLKLGAAYTWHDIHTDRSIGLPGFAAYSTASYHAGTAQAFGELGYGLQVSGVDFTPFANLAYVNQHIDGFAEQGGPEALFANGANENVVFSTFGVHMATGFDLAGFAVTAKTTLGWRHAYGEVNPSTTFNFAGSDAFAIHGLPITRDAALVDAGLDVQVAKNATVGLSYEGQFGRRSVDQSIHGTLTLNF